MSISKAFNSLSANEIPSLIWGTVFSVGAGIGLIAAGLCAEIHAILVTGVVLAGIGTIGPAGFILHRAWTLRDKSETIEAAKGILEEYIGKL